MDFIVRSLEFGDIFAAGKVVKRVNLKPILKQFSNKEDVTGKTNEEKKRIELEKGIDLLIQIIENIDSGETEIYKLIADMSGLKTEDVRRFSLSDLQNFVAQFMTVNKMDEIKVFFKQATGLKA